VFFPVLGSAYYFFIRPRMLRSGTELGELVGPFPGDDLIPSPNYQATRAITIDAPPHVVWAWLAQLGRDGTGFYGVDSLTNNGVPSASYLRKDLPAPQAGASMDSGNKIFAAEPEHLLLYGAFDLPTPLGESMERSTLFLLEPLADGTTRLLIRSRGYTYGVLGPVYNLYYEVMDYLNSHAQLRNIKQRAETLTRLQAPITL
jgi:hypothetical protein